jgi:galactokinase
VYGARLTGGGFGGCAIALVDAGLAEQAGRTITARYREATGIDAGWFVTGAAGGPRVTWD